MQLQQDAKGSIMDISLLVSVCDDTGVGFSMNFGHRKIYQEISCTIIGTSIGMSMYPGHKFFIKFGHLKLGHVKNSWEMLDQ